MSFRLTQIELKKILHYDPERGIFTWAKSRDVAGCKKGNQAGTIKKGRRIITINYKEYPSTHIAWVYMNGYLPENVIDHRDRCTLNDRFKNLREVSVVCNARNTGNRCDTTSGVKGVHKVSQTGKWCSQIALNGSRKYLGTFNEFDEAVCHRLAAEQCFDWDGCDLSSPAFQYVNNTIQRSV